jgi:hypothetical protein
MTMSGLFERIARRRATPPDETQELDAPALAGSASSGDEPAPPETPSPDGADTPVAEDAPTVQSEAVTEDAPTAPLRPVGVEGESVREGKAVGEDEAAAPGEAAVGGALADAPDPTPSFRERGRVRRRVRYLRRVRELQLRDLGGLVFELRRFGRQREDLVSEKLTQLETTDEELRQLETVLDDRRAVVELREPGIGGTCPSCGALHGSADRFCSHCGRPLDAAAANGSGERAEPEPATTEVAEPERAANGSSEVAEHKPEPTPTPTEPPPAA